MSRGTQVPPAPLSISHTGLSPSMEYLPRYFCYLLMDHFMEALQPQILESTWFGLFPFRSPLLWESLLISSPPGTEMFHFPGFASLSLYIQPKNTRTLLQVGSPIRKSPDHSLLDGSPKLIAAYHVLHRLLTPRHPPIALNILTLYLYSYPYLTVTDHKALYRAPKSSSHSITNQLCCPL